MTECCEGASLRAGNPLSSRACVHRHSSSWRLRIMSFWWVQVFFSCFYLSRLSLGGNVVQTCKAYKRGVEKQGCLLVPTVYFLLSRNFCIWWGNAFFGYAYRFVFLFVLVKDVKACVWFCCRFLLSTLLVVLASFTEIAAAVSYNFTSIITRGSPFWLWQGFVQVTKTTVCLLRCCFAKKQEAVSIWSMHACLFYVANNSCIHHFISLGVRKAKVQRRDWYIIYMPLDGAPLLRPRCGEGAVIVEASVCGWKHVLPIPETNPSRLSPWSVTTHNSFIVKILSYLCQELCNKTGTFGVLGHGSHVCPEKLCLIADTFFLCVIDIAKYALPE